MTEVSIRLPNPHSEIQKKIFYSLSTPGLLETWVACGTKVGKTLGASVALASRFPRKRQAIWRWVAPTYSQALIGQRYIERMLPPKPYTDPIQYKLRIPSLDSQVEFKSGEKPENLEGEACAGYVLDETSKMRKEVYSSAKTTLTVTQGPLVALSTPRGKNWFYNKCMEAKEEMEWALAKNVTPTKIYLTAPTSINPKIPQSVIEEARKSLPDRLFRQYYLAEFVEDSATFLGFRECYYTDRIDMYEEHQIWFMPGFKETVTQVVIGADWAKTTDWTVFIAADLATKKIVAFERFHKRPYTQAIRQLVRFAHQFKEVISVYHDKTGVGQAIDDQLSYTDLPYEGITFTNNSKTNMVNSLITSVETKGISLPYWNVLDLELDAYEVSTTELGTMTYSAPSGQHDDTVCALMLVNAALEKYAERDVDIQFLEDMKEDTDPNAVSAIEAYYNDIREDEF